MSSKILIVDDENAIRDMLRLALEMNGHECIEAGNIQDAYSLIVDESPELILLDWMMPGGSGIELMRRMKRDEVGQSIPVIMLTAKADEDNKVKGLDVGADDYIIKPFATKELMARIKAVLRRSSSVVSSKLEVKGLKIDNESHRVFIEDSPVDMSPTEYKLLEFFMSHPDRVYSRNQLLDFVWGGNVYVEERTVDVHIRRLRKVLQSATNVEFDYGQLIQTVRGVGYRFSSSIAAA